MPRGLDHLDAAADRLNLGRDAASVRKRIEAMEQMLERMFVVPGINKPVGLDVLLDLVPVVGPTVAAGLGAWIAWEARNLGLPKRHVARMAGNIGLDFVLGAIPWIGAIPDFFFRSNSRNLKILKRHLDKVHPQSATVDAAPIGKR